MTKKLTLSVEQQTIERAKAYAELEGRSLSNMVEQYLRSLVRHKTQGDNLDTERKNINPKILALWGSVKAPDGVGKNEEIDYKGILGKALEAKHL